jgi:hypothetical protein
VTRALVALAVLLVAGCNEGNDALFNQPAPDLQALPPTDLSVSDDLASTGPTCGKLALCAIECGTDLACIGQCGAGADPREIAAAVLLAACAVQNCFARGDGGMGGLGGGLSLSTIRCLGSKCSQQVQGCRGFGL